MVDILNQLSDNQMALAGCLGAAGASLVLLMISYHGTGGNRGQRVEKSPQTLSTREENRPERRAA